MTRSRRRHLPDYLEQIPGWSTKRVHKDGNGHITSVETDSGAVSPLDVFSSLTLPPRGLEVTLDDNHIHELGSFKRFEFSGDIGGEFLSTKSGTFCSVGKSHLHEEYLQGSDHVTVDYLGPMLPQTFVTNGYQWPNGSGGSADLSSVGTTAIARCKPTNSVASLATDLVETKTEGLPHFQGASLWRDKTLSAKNAGEEYLNQEFGWNPLVSDIRGASYAAANAHRILNSYEHNSHKMVRRRYEFPVKQTTSIAQFGTAGALTPLGHLSVYNQSFYPFGKVYRMVTTYKKQWFSGAFTYHLPLGFNSRNSLVRAAARAKPLLGIALTPDVVWNALPWTWALDWVSNIGDCISIYSDMATDGLVIKYGYIMEHAFTRYDYYFVPSQANLNPLSSASFPLFTSYVETKKRERATPFGFEIGWEGLSLRQLAISAALGLTRWL